MHSRLKRLESVIKIQEIEAKRKDEEFEKLEKVVKNQKKKITSKNKEDTKVKAFFHEQEEKKRKMEEDEKFSVAKKKLKTASKNKKSSGDNEVEKRSFNACIKDSGNDAVNAESNNDSVVFSSTDKYQSCKILKHRRMKTPYIKGAKRPKGFKVFVTIDNEKESWELLPDIMSDVAVSYGQKVLTLKNDLYWKVPRRSDVMFWLHVVHVDLSHQAVLKLYSQKKKAKYSGFLCTAIGDNGFTGEDIKCEEIPKQLIDDFISTYVENDNSD